MFHSFILFLPATLVDNSESVPTRTKPLSQEKISWEPNLKLTFGLLLPCTFFYYRIGEYPSRFYEVSLARRETDIEL